MLALTADAASLAPQAKFQESKKTGWIFLGALLVATDNFGTDDRVNHLWQFITDSVVCSWGAFSKTDLDAKTQQMKTKKKSIKKAHHTNMLISCKIYSHSDFSQVALVLVSASFSVFCLVLFFLLLFISCFGPAHLTKMHSDFTPKSLHDHKHAYFSINKYYISQTT